jgi:hypothetical protein
MHRSAHSRANWSHSSSLPSRHEASVPALIALTRSVRARAAGWHTRPAGSGASADARREGRLYEVTATRAPRAPFASTTCVPSVPHVSVGSMRASRARSARASLIFVRCASSPGTACAALRALLRTSRTGSTRFDAWSSRRGRPESTLGEPPHVLGGCVVCWKGGAPPALHAPARAGALGAGGVVRAPECTPTEPLGSCGVCKACTLFGVPFRSSWSP